MNLLTAGIPLGRWFGINVLMHWTFLMYALARISNSREPKWDGIFLGLLFLIVLLHEFGHSLACRSVGGRADHIVLWPLGGLAFVNPPPRPGAQLWTTVAGPLVNAVLIPVCWVVYRQVDHVLPIDSQANFWISLIAQVCLSINIGLLVFNLLPIYPLDGGRMLQEILWFFIGFPRSLITAGMIGTLAGIGFIVLGLGLWQIVISLPFLGPYVLGGRDGQMNFSLILIGILAAFESFRAYRQGQEILGWQRR